MRYVVIPGEMRSRTDGQTHYIGVGQLLHLYRVPPSARVVVLRNRLDWDIFREQEGDVYVRPRYDGNYPVFAQ